MNMISNEFTKNFKGIDSFFKNRNLPEFQIKIIKKILLAIEQNKYIISANLLPGYGKSIVISNLVDFLYSNKIINKILIISENKILLDQQHRILNNVNPNIMVV